MAQASLLKKHPSQGKRHFRKVIPLLGLAGALAITLSCSESPAERERHMARREDTYAYLKQGGPEPFIQSVPASGILAKYAGKNVAVRKAGSGKVIFFLDGRQATGETLSIDFLCQGERMLTVAGPALTSGLNPDSDYYRSLVLNLARASDANDTLFVVPERLIPETPGEKAAGLAKQLAPSSLVKKLGEWELKALQKHGPIQ